MFRTHRASLGKLPSMSPLTAHLLVCLLTLAARVLALALIIGNLLVPLDLFLHLIWRQVLS